MRGKVLSLRDGTRAFHLEANLWWGGEKKRRDWEIGTLNPG